MTIEFSYRIFGVFFSESMFPKASGLWFNNEQGKKVAVVARSGKYMTPKGGWAVPGRTYHILEESSTDEIPKAPTGDKRE